MQQNLPEPMACRAYLNQFSTFSLIQTSSLALIVRHQDHVQSKRLRGDEKVVRTDRRACCLKRNARRALGCVRRRLQRDDLQQRLGSFPAVRPGCRHSFFAAP